MTAPFEIAPLEGGVGGRVASNGATRLTVLEPEAKLFRRRAIKVNAGKPPAETALPLLNALAGDLVADLTMPADVLHGRLAAIADAARGPTSTQVEWAVAELNGVRVYFDGRDVVVTTRDMQP